MKLVLGQRVIVKSLEELKKDSSILQQNNNFYNNNNHFNCILEPYMLQYCSEVMIIEKIDFNNTWFKLKDVSDRYGWEEWMIKSEIEAMLDLLL